MLALLTTSFEARLDASPLDQCHVFIRFCEVDWIRLSSEILQSGGWAGLQIPMVIAPLAITRRVQINWCLTHTCPVRGLRLDSHAFHESDTYV